jgi:hypothetical protein
VCACVCVCACVQVCVCVCVCVCVVLAVHVTLEFILTTLTSNTLNEQPVHSPDEAWPLTPPVCVCVCVRVSDVLVCVRRPQDLSNGKIYYGRSANTDIVVAATQVRRKHTHALTRTRTCTRMYAPFPPPSPPLNPHAHMTTWL